jgi:2-polyprenyl-6-methoxyphenol hydroxylase-like FAD-dependent oxidoreductase
LVLDEPFSKRVGVPAAQMLRRCITACPEMRRRCENAVFPESNGVTADFSYTCHPFAGPGYFLVGDAATFVDPIFSTGVCLGMMSAKMAAEEIDGVLNGARSARAARKAYIRYVTRSSSAFFSLVDMYYDHTFRELFLHGRGPVNIHRAVIELLAGNVFPAPRTAVRWRVALFRWLIRLQRWMTIVPHRDNFSLESALGTEGDPPLWTVDRANKRETVHAEASA